MYYVDILYIDILSLRVSIILNWYTYLQVDINEEQTSVWNKSTRLLVNFQYTDYYWNACLMDDKIFWFSSRLSVWWRLWLLRKYAL